jgi:hydroxymethylglutaryl-CoA lyase
MADTVELIAKLRPSISELAILIPKLSYYRRLEESDPDRKVDTVALFVSSSESYSQANTRMNKATAFAAAREVAKAARERGYRCRGYLSCAFRDLDPESHEMEASVVLGDARQLLDMGCDEVCLSDTDGRATPRDVERIVGHLREHVPVEAIGAHLHDRYGQGLANALVAHRLGVRTFDSSIGGIGGSRAVRNSVGNISTEELVSLFESMGVSTGVDQEQLVEAGRMIIEMTRLVGDPLPPSAPAQGLLRLPQRAVGGTDRRLDAARSQGDPSEPELGRAAHRGGPHADGHRGDRQRGDHPAGSHHRTVADPGLLGLLHRARCRPAAERDLRRRRGWAAGRLELRRLTRR